MTPMQRDGSELALEARLLLRVAQQDREAFAELFRIVAPKVKSYLIRRGGSPASAEELTQDVMVTVWRKAAQFDPAKAGALTWLFVIARNRWIDSLRRERSTVTYGVEPPEAMDEDAEDGFDVAAGSERDRLVREAMEELPPDQKEVVLRSFFAEQSHPDIAAALGLPLGTVKSRLRLAMAKLRNRLDLLK
jgi:RNA polymerase sigma-70 factor, ECF subfamily